MHMISENVEKLNLVWKTVFFNTKDTQLNLSTTHDKRNLLFLSTFKKKLGVWYSHVRIIVTHEHFHLHMHIQLISIHLDYDIFGFYFFYWPFFLFYVSSQSQHTYTQIAVSKIGQQSHMHPHTTMHRMHEHLFIGRSIEFESSRRECM